MNKRWKEKWIKRYDKSKSEEERNKKEWIKMKTNDKKEVRK